MRKGISFLSLLFLVLIFAISCGRKAEDIRLSDLKTACDYVTAMTDVFDEAQIIIKDTKHWEDLNNLQKEKLKILRNKLDEISEAAKKKFTKAEAKECSNYKKMVEKAKKLNNVFIE
jgi:hypothetical protein